MDAHWSGHPALVEQTKEVDGRYNENKTKKKQVYLLSIAQQVSVKVD